MSRFTPIQAAILAMAFLAAPAFGAPSAAYVDGSAAGGPVIEALDQGQGPVAAVFITGGAARGPCMEAAAAAVGARYRAISFALEEDFTDSGAGREAAAAALADLLARAGVERACVVGCGSLAALIEEAVLAEPAIRAAVLLGNPPPASILPVPAVFLGAAAEPVTVVESVLGLLAPRPAPARFPPARSRIGEAYPL